MTATDGDKDRPQNIVYFLTGQGIDPDNPANSKFDINRTSGEIYVLKVINATSLPHLPLLPLIRSPLKKKKILSLFLQINRKKREKNGYEIRKDGLH